MRRYLLILLGTAVTLLGVYAALAFWIMPIVLNQQTSDGSIAAAYRWADLDISYTYSQPRQLTDVELMHYASKQVTNPREIGAQRNVLLGAIGTKKVFLSFECVSVQCNGDLLKCDSSCNELMPVVHYDAPVEHFGENEQNVQTCTSLGGIYLSRAVTPTMDPPRYCVPVSVARIKYRPYVAP